MRVLIVRHGKAEEKTEWALTGQPDSLRPLTSDGKKDFRKSVKGLKELLENIDGLFSSPYARAVETAEILAAEFHVELEKTTDLTPPLKYKNLIRLLQGCSKIGKDVIALVGHEPDLGYLIGWFLTGEMKSFVEFKKGGAVLLDFPGAVEPGEARLLWYAPPAVTKKIQ